MHDASVVMTFCDSYVSLIQELINMGALMHDVFADVLASPAVYQTMLQSGTYVLIISAALWMARCKIISALFYWISSIALRNTRKAGVKTYYSVIKSRHITYEFLHNT